MGNSVWKSCFALLLLLNYTFAIPTSIQASPINSTDNGDPNLRCNRAKFTDIALFFLANYFAHCATVKMMPGETAVRGFTNALMALFFPTSGIIRAIFAIARHARFTKKDELWMAKRAGALCMLVRSRHWVPQEGEVLRQYRTLGSQSMAKTNQWKYEYLPREANGTAMYNKSNPLPDFEAEDIPICVWNPHWMAELLLVVGSQRIYPEGRKVHGNLIIPKGYRLAYVPSDADVVISAQSTQLGTDLSQHYGTISNISSTYSFPKAIIAIFQTVYAAITLYRTRGSQIELFGYAAFGLTTTPYIIMSIVNLFAQLATPDYEALYMVRSDVMIEAEKRGGIFDGVVGELVHDEIAEPDPRSFTVIIRKEQNSAFFHLDPMSGLDNIHAKVDSATDNSNSVEPITRTPRFFPFRPEVKEAKSRILGYQEWLYIPSCTPFRRSCTITDNNLGKPRRPEWFSSESLDSDKADEGYAVAESKIPERKHLNLLLFWIPLGISSISIIVNGAISGFRAGGSSIAQRVWTMSWLIFGMALAPLGPSLGQAFASLIWTYFIRKDRDSGVIGNITSFLLAFILVGILFGILFTPAIGGLVVVGEMIKQYGSCSIIS
jgi:hypothetical protein